MKASNDTVESSLTLGSRNQKKGRSNGRRAGTLICGPSPSSTCLSGGHLEGRGALCTFVGRLQFNPRTRNTQGTHPKSEKAQGRGDGGHAPRGGGTPKLRGGHWETLSSMGLPLPGWEPHTLRTLTGAGIVPSAEQEAGCLLVSVSRPSAQGPAPLRGSAEARGLGEAGSPPRPTQHRIGHRHSAWNLKGQTEREVRTADP